MGKLVAARRQVVLVTAVGVACRVGVVAEQVDVAADALLGKALLSRVEELFEDPLPRLVVGDEVVERVALDRKSTRLNSSHRL